MCDSEQKLMKGMDHYFWWFVTSKFLEYIDSIFLVIRRKCVIVLFATLFFSAFPLSPFSTSVRAYGCEEFGGSMSAHSASPMLLVPSFLLAQEAHLRFPGRRKVGHFLVHSSGFVH
jgi:hypothetical protein